MQNEALYITMEGKPCVLRIGFHHLLCYTLIFFFFFLGGGAVAQSAERATPGEEVPGSIPAVAARSLLFGSVSVQCDRLRQKSWSPHSVSVWQHVKLSYVSLGTRPRYSLVVDEDVKKPNKQTNTSDF